LSSVPPHNFAWPCWYNWW